MRVVRTTLFTAVLAFGAAFLTGATAQEAGTLTGQVVDATTNEPLTGVQITVVGTRVGGLTDAQGRYLLTAVPVGVRQVRAQLIGYARVDQEVTVTGGQTAVANFGLEPTAIELDAVTVTATGAQQRREVANATSSIQADDVVNQAPISSVDELITGRAAGVSILQTAGTTGTASRIRIRGSTSISLSNEPIIYIDGVRVSGDQTSLSIGVGGQDFSRLNDINPESIESIEIVKGPSAATLYGTDAANGVILITTKRGFAGAQPRWNVYMETGWLTDENEYPFNYAARDADGDDCFAFQVASGSCTQAEILRHQPLEDPQVSPFGTGTRQQIGASVAGGAGRVTYFVSGEYDEEVGVLELPDFYRNQLLETVDEIPDYQIHPNALERISLNANLGAALREDLQLNITTSYLTSDGLLPQNDNNALGIVPSGMLGTAFDTEDANFGYGFLTPAQVFAVEVRQNVERYVTGANFNWEPLDWLTGRATFGLDNVARHDESFSAVGAQPFDPTGERESNRIQIRNYTADAGATADFDLTESLTSRSSVGLQYIREFFQGTFASGDDLAPGTKTVSAAANQFADESTTESKTLGIFAEQQFGWNNRLFVTGALRADDNSAFGADFDAIIYPKVGVSFVALESMDEPWLAVINSLRLRGAWGASGRAPGATDALTFFSPVAATIAGADVPGVTFGDLGNVELKPERSQEIEVGFDAGFLNDRVGVEFTWYDKNTEDVLVERPLPPSLGVSTDRFDNLGEVENKGWELGLNALALNLDKLEWNINASVSRNKNELIELGLEADSILFGPQRFQEGFPLGGYFTNEITFEDADGDGIIGADEFEVAEAATFVGSPFPETEFALRSDLTLFDLVRVSGLLDHRSGFYNNNFTEVFRCFFLSCQGLNDPNAPLFEQARALDAVLGTGQPFIEDASFWKLRELAFTLLIPGDLVGRIGADNASLSVTGRNLATWTDYTGLDPELSGQGATNFSTREFLTQPPVRTWVVRLNLGF